jgi:hypothetical protein
MHAKFRNILITLCVVLALAQALPAQKKKKDPCSQHPELLLPPKQSEKDKQQKITPKIQGSVAIVIDEDGNVANAQAIAPLTGDAASQLESFVRTMKYKPRTGCGNYKTVVTFSSGS